MKKLFVPYDIAIQLKELGFDEMCFSFYDKRDTSHPVELLFCRNSGGWLLGDNCAAPLFQQAIDFLRKKNIQVIELPKEKYFGGSSIRPQTNAWAIIDDSERVKGCYGVALALRKAIEILKSKKS